VLQLHVDDSQFERLALLRQVGLHLLADEVDAGDLGLAGVNTSEPTLGNVPLGAL
jgi:hypothetical protein